jgi:phospholipid transport system substrate-binding protein
MIPAPFTRLAQGLSVALLTAVLMIGLGSAPARSNPASATSAIDFIQGLSEEILTFLGEDNLDNDTFTEQFRAFIMKGFDVATVGRIALGPYWRRATPEQQIEYQALFIDYLVKNYASQFRQFSGETLEITGFIEVDEDETIVTSQVISPDSPNIHVDWHVRTQPEKNVVLDIIIEGLRLTRTLRDEFSDLIRVGGGDLEVLLQVLRERAPGVSPGGA